MADMSKLARGLRGACANCGGRGIFSGLGLEDECPTCGHRFEREQGYWLGAIAVNTGVTFAIFGATFLVVALATWPDVPWTGMWVGLVAFMAAFPIVFHRISKTIWVGLDLAFRPVEENQPNSAARDLR